MQASDNSFYGTTANGGEGGLGTVYRITPSASLRCCIIFRGGADGARPYSHLIQSQDGSFYGMTGGSPGIAGTIYRMSLQVT